MIIMRFTYGTLKNAFFLSFFFFNGMYSFAVTENKSEMPKRDSALQISQGWGTRAWGACGLG